MIIGNYLKLYIDYQTKIAVEQYEKMVNYEPSPSEEAQQPLFNAPLEEAKQPQLNQHAPPEEAPKPILKKEKKEDPMNSMAAHPDLKSKTFQLDHIKLKISYLSAFESEADVLINFTTYKDFQDDKIVQAAEL